MKSKLPYLPDDLITEILLRSSVKSVGRFRCLSKMFYSMLSDPNFARNQLELTLRRRSNMVRSDNRRLIISSSQKLFLVDLDSMDVEREYSSKEDLILLSKRTDIIGSSNGLVCVRYVHNSKDKEGEALLYNPITRDSKIIPKLPETLHCKLKPHHRYMFGFGFDALTNDYKMVKLVSYKENKHNKHTVCYVYSLKTDSWKRINNLLPYYSYGYVSSKNIKGAIHWIASTEEGEEQKELMAFDLEKEELREMTLPNWTEEFDLNMRCFTVDTLKGCLCVVHGCFKMHNVIWVMREYGIESSWCKMKISISDYSIKPTLCLSKNDKEVLLVLDGHFVYWKPRKEFYMKTKATPYVESLISPNSFGEYIEMNK